MSPPSRRRAARAAAVLALALLACGGPRRAAPGEAVTSFRLPGERPLRAAFLVVDGVYNTELVAPWDVFEHTAGRAEPAIEVYAVSPDGGPVTTAEGLVVAADYGFADAPTPDLLVVPSAEGSRDRDLEDRAMIDWVRNTGEAAQLVMSLCWGAFVLAEAGLLEGHAATTFPGDYDTFAGRFPQLDLRINVSFVHHGRALTSQGGARSFEAALYLVERLYGEEVAGGIAGGLLVDWPPGPSRAPEVVSDPTFRVETDAP